MLLTRNGPLPNDPSVQSNTRIRKTHKDPETIARIQKLPIDSKLKMNFEKQTRNAAHRERAIIDADDVSDASSYISIPEEEYEKMTRDQPFFDRVKSLLLAHTLSWLAEKRKSLRTRPREGDDADASTNGPDSQPSKRYRVNEELIAVDPTSPPIISFDPDFLELGHYGYHIPLALFTNKNIEFINNNSISFGRSKITHLTGKPQMLILSDLIKKIQDSQEAGPTRDLDLEHFEWMEATANTANFYLFHTKLYREGDEANDPQFYKKHFGFFENQTDSVKLFDLWKDIELELRLKHQSKKTAFDLFDYRTEWGRVKSRSDAVEAPPSNISSSSTRRSRFSKPTKPLHDNPPASSSNSFPIGNKDKASREPCCIICGGIGHTFFGHSNSLHGPPKWVVQDGKELLHPTSKARLCTYWNIFSHCSKKCPSTSHVCTFCGGPHPALRWDPSCRVSRPAGY